jgi:hypothetical protein
MFKINPSPTFKAFVSLTVPGQEAPGAVSFTFRHQGRAALDTWIKAASDKTDAALLGAVISGWEGVSDQDDLPLAYSADNLGLLLDAYPAAGGEIFMGYLKALTESRAKN